MNEKKSFVLYYDSYPLLALLPPEQRGHLISAVFQFAMGASQSPPVSQEDILAQFPALTPEARMCFHALAATVSRDTRTWQNKQAARMRRAGTEEDGKAEAEHGESPAGNAASWVRKYPRRSGPPDTGAEDIWKFV